MPADLKQLAFAKRKPEVVAEFKVMKRLFLALIFAVWFSPAEADAVIRVRGGNIFVHEDCRVVLVEAPSTIHLPQPDELRPPVLVTVLEEFAEPTHIVADGYRIQGRSSLELSGQSSTVLYPINGMGYVR